MGSPSSELEKVQVIRIGVSKSEMGSLFVICCTFALLVLPIVLGASVGNDNDNGNDNGNVIDNSKRSGPGNVVTNEKTESNNNATCEAGMDPESISELLKSIRKMVEGKPKKCNVINKNCNDMQCCFYESKGFNQTNADGLDAVVVDAEEIQVEGECRLESSWIYIFLGLLLLVILCFLVCCCCVCFCKSGNRN